MTTTEPLSEGQAAILNDLANANDRLVRALDELGRRVEKASREIASGTTIEGFENDVLGQPGREIQHAHSTRSALIRAAYLAGVAEPVILHAMGYDVAEHSRVRNRRILSAGFTLEIGDEATS